MAKRNTPQLCFTSTMVIILLLLALVFFGITLALGITGIVIATRESACNEEVVTDDCLQPSAQDMGLMEQAFENLRGSANYLYWLIGSTLCGLMLFSIGGSCCVWTAAQILYIIMKDNGPPKSDTNSLQNFAMVEIEGEATQHSEDNEATSEINETGTECVPYNTKVWIEIEGIDKPKQDPKKWEEFEKGPERQAIRIEDGLYELVSEYDDGLHLQKLGAGAFIGIWLSFLCGILSILSLLWAFALGFNRSRRIEQSVTHFVVANCLSGIITPILFFISAFIMVNIADYFTNHKIEAHLMLTQFFPDLKFEEGENSKGKACKQWVLGDSLVLKINKEESTTCLLPRAMYRKYFRFCAMCLPNCATILLSVIVVLTLTTSFTYFIDITLVNEVTVSSCSDSNINNQYSCFRAGSLSPVNCASNNNATQRLHCFRFYRFDVDVDLITATSSAFAFYLLTKNVISGVLYVKRVLHNLTNRLGELCIISGLLLLLTSGVVGFLWISGYASDSFSLVAHLDVLNLAQLIMLSLFLIIVGFLVRQGEWMERRPAKHKLVKFEKNEDNQIVYN